MSAETIPGGPARDTRRSDLAARLRSALSPAAPEALDPEEPSRLGQWLLALLVGIPMAITAIALLPELTIGIPSLNDDAFHYLLVQRASEALAAGRNPLDFWVPQLELGFPQFLYYQHLPHLVVVALERLYLGSVDLLTLFNLLRYLLLVGLPVTVYWSMRRMGFSMVAAAVSAAASSLLSANARYGFEYDSYVWRGLGMYTQLWAMHLSFISLACVHRVLQRGTGYVPAILALSLLILSHVLYAYMMAITLVVVLLAGATRSTLLPRLARLGIVGGVAVAATAYMWLPFLTSSEYLSASTYLQDWKYDSFGAPAILGWLFSGDLLDHGRLPVLTALLASGVIAAVVRRTGLAALALAGLAVWLVLYFGRPTLGPIADLLPMHDGLLMHRFLGSVDLFVIILIGLGGAWAWSWFARSRSIWYPALAFAVLTVVLVPAFVERVQYYDENTRWMAETRDALDKDTDLIAVLGTLAADPGGRTYAGLRGNWGTQLQVGYLKVSDLLTFYRFPAVSPPYQSLSLNADLIWHFQDGDLTQYDLLDVRHVIVPASFTVPEFYQLALKNARYALYTVPTSGAADFVALIERRAAPSQRALFDANLAWFQGTDVAAGRHIRWDYPAAAPEGPFTPSDGCPDGGLTEYERVEADAIHLLVECPADATLALKVTYHPNWKVTVDGQPTETFMVSPSYVGLDLPAGRHQVDAVYEATPSKLPLLLLGVAALIAAVRVRRRLDLLAERLSRGPPQGAAQPSEEGTAVPVGDTAESAPGGGVS